MIDLVRVMNSSPALNDKQKAMHAQLAFPGEWWPERDSPTLLLLPLSGGSAALLSPQSLLVSRSQKSRDLFCRERFMQRRVQGHLSPHDTSPQQRPFGACKGCLAWPVSRSPFHPFHVGYISCLHRGGRWRQSRGDVLPPLSPPSGASLCSAPTRDGWGKSIPLQKWPWAQHTRLSLS